MTSESKDFSVADRARSFVHAFRGIRTLIVSQHNAWIHAAATVAVVVVALATGVSRIEWCFLLLAMASVWTAEALNTALELLCDAVSPEFHPLVGQAKDVSAGAVLICAIGAAGVGLLVLGPRALALVAPALVG